MTAPLRHKLHIDTSDDYTYSEQRTYSNQNEYGEHSGRRYTKLSASQRAAQDQQSNELLIVFAFVLGSLYITYFAMMLSGDMKENPDCLTGKVFCQLPFG